MIEFREIKEKSEYLPHSINEGAPFTQGWLYGEWQEMSGRKVRRFQISENGRLVGYFQTIKYSFPLGQSIIYIPHGPVLNPGFTGAGFLDDFYKKLLEIAKEENAVFVRFDFYSSFGGAINSRFKKVPGYAYHSSYFQPKFEWLLDLSKSEEEILNGMHPKTRYNIGLAERRGVEIEIIPEEFEKYFNDFYALLAETARRDKFNLHPESYYRNIFFTPGGSASGGKTLAGDNAFLVIAKYEGKILLINLILLSGNTAYFLFGGSSGENKNLMAPHLAHWVAIKEAKARGFEIYNFGAIGEARYEGISRFKKGFGGRILEYSDSYDLVLKPFWYFMYNLRKRFL